MKKLYFLGPKGTYSEQAAYKIKNKLMMDLELIPISTIAKIVEIVNNDENAFAILPIENSIEGVVRQTIDSLYSSEVKIRAQIELEIKHCLFSKGQQKDIKHIISHPQALAQCQKYILLNYDENIDLIYSSSTAAAVCELENKDETYAAISSSKVDCTKKLNLIDENITDKE